MPRDVVPFILGSSKVVQVSKLRNVLSPGYSNAATVTYTLADASTALPVEGAETFPMALSYVSGSDGLYRATLSYDLDVTLGQRLTATYLAVQGTLRKTWTQQLLVVAQA